MIQVTRGLAGRIEFVSFDSSDMHIGLMLVQDPYRIGHEAVRSLVMKLNGQTRRTR